MARCNNLARLEDMIRVQFGESGGQEKMAGELRDESVQKILLDGSMLIFELKHARSCLI